MTHNYETWKKTVHDDISIRNEDLIYFLASYHESCVKEDQWQSKGMPDSLDRMTQKLPSKVYNKMWVYEMSLSRIQQKGTKIK